MPKTLPVPENLRLAVDAAGLESRHAAGVLAAAQGALAGAGVPLSRCYLRLERRAADRVADRAMEAACSAASTYLTSRGIPCDGVTLRLVVTAD